MSKPVFKRIWVFLRYSKSTTKVYFVNITPVTSVLLENLKPKHTPPVLFGKKPPKLKHLRNMKKSFIFMGKGVFPLLFSSQYLGDLENQAPRFLLTTQNSKFLNDIIQPRRSKGRKYCQTILFSKMDRKSLLYRAQLHETLLTCYQRPPPHPLPNSSSCIWSYRTLKGGEGRAGWTFVSRLAHMKLTGRCRAVVAAAPPASSHTDSGGARVTPCQAPPTGGGCVGGAGAGNARPCPGWARRRRGAAAEGGPHMRVPSARSL